MLEREGEGRRGVLRWRRGEEEEEEEIANGRTLNKRGREREQNTSNDFGGDVAGTGAATWGRPACETAR